MLILATLGLGFWSVYRTLRHADSAAINHNNIPVRKIGYAVGVGALLLMVVTFALGSSDAMTINGVKYTDKFWLKASDMFIYTALILMLVAVGAVIYGATKYIRR